MFCGTSIPHVFLSEIIHISLEKFHNANCKSKIYALYSRLIRFKLILPSSTSILNPHKTSPAKHERAPSFPPDHALNSARARKGSRGRAERKARSKGLNTSSSLLPREKNCKHGTSPTMLPPKGQETCFLKNIHSQRIFPDKNDTRI